jgi:hypothetical protein
MTVLALANIPSNINTYERLAVWVGQCLQNIANGQEVNVQAGAQAQPIASVQLITTADGVYRALVTCYLPINLAAINDPAEKSWMATTDISTADVHANFKTN